MKKWFSFLMAVVMSTAVLSAQTQKEVIKERKEMQKFTKSELNARASKDARKQARQLKREGWKVAPGHLPLEKQLDRSYQMQYEFEDNGMPKYLYADVMSIGESYDAAKFQALEIAKLELAGLAQTDVVALVESRIGNEQLSKEQAASISETVASSKNLIAKKMGRILTVVECYRTKNTKNQEVRLMVFYNAKMAAESAKAAIREELSKKGEELSNQLDQLLGF